MDRSALLWTLVVFFGASIVFSTIRNATDDQRVGVTLGLEVLAGLVLVGAIVLIVRRRR
jgi:membrane protein DedA with SNARE-associated domain